MRTVGKTACVAVLAAALLAGAGAGASARSEPEAVGRLDVARYTGTWYQVAAVPAPFERQCERNVEAEYRLLPSGGVSVDNTCRTYRGRTSRALGEALPLDRTGARLNVSFERGRDGDFRHTRRANYIVVGLADDYSWAVTTDADRRSGFVLSRTPGLGEEARQDALEAIEDADLDACAFQVTRQDGAAERVGPFC